MYQIRWHGRGGQGAVTAARIFGLAAAVYENSYAQSFPAFGVERRGAPVLAFTKISDAPILDRSQIEEPDFVVVLDAGLLKTVDVTAGLKAGGKIVINADTVPLEILLRREFDVFTVSAHSIALNVLGRPITNTAMVGALCAAIKVVELASVEKAIVDLFPAALAGKNVQAARAAFHEVQHKQKGEMQL
ncbi:MAG: 2-oxoacid:acceptor oxidoreductase family protein [Desulfocucumaceae bacterium]